MVHLNHREYFQDPTNHIHVPSPPAAPHPATLDIAADLSFPFGKIDGLDRDDLRMTAYEIFFTACRSSPGFGARTAVTFYQSEGREHGTPGSPGSPRHGGVGMAVTSRTKKALGLKMLKRTPSTRRSSSCGSNPFSPTGFSNNHNNGSNGISPRASFSTLPTHGKIRRPMTSAEIMRQQMKVSEGSDNRLRKTIMRTLVGQTGRRPDTIILPLELLRQLKPSEFSSSNEYHIWQKRQLKILEAGLLDHPSIPLDKSNNFAVRLREIIHRGDTKPIDTNKSSETMRAICNCVVSLSWRTANGSPTDVCHWADGYPFNVHLYVALLRSIFDPKDETCVLDEVDELLELMKKTWSTLGITRPIHNLCFTWVLFEQYVMTGQIENDLLSASLTMLAEVANDAKKADRQPVYMEMLAAVLNSMKTWSEKQLLDYHESFNKGTVGLMENILPMVFSATKILEEDVPAYKRVAIDRSEEASDHTGNRMLDNGNRINGSMSLQEASEKLIQLAKETEELAIREKGLFSSMLKKWHPISAGVAAVTLHTCYGNLLRQFLAANSMISNETVAVLQRANKLEKVLVNMVVEDSVECEDGGKTVVREMVPYEVDAIVLRYLRQWIQDCLKKAKDVVQTAKDTETWNPKSKSEPYAQSAVELMKQTKDAIDSFFDIPIGVSEDLVRSKQSYIPTLPPLTRCGRDSKFIKLWRMAAPCSVVNNEVGCEEGNYSRPSTSRGTQRLYIRLNTLHYILSQLQSFEKSLALSPRIILSPKNRLGGSRAGGSYFEQTRSAIQSVTQHVSEVAAYRLIFLDSNSVFYGSLYMGDVENSRITPAVKIMKHNLTLLTAIVTDRAQPIAMKEVMKATFEAYLTVLLAGGSPRSFTRADHRMIEEDLRNLKRVFVTGGEGLIVEDVVDREAEAVEGVVALMGQATEQLVEEFRSLVCEASGVLVTGGAGQKLPMPPTTGKWSSTDPNTILRVLCHRNDSAANYFLKKTFQLPKRK
ncbi:Mammalian uncoordinated homology 13, domain 2 [Cynara cardunculus var. scolymus]|uniref:Mammalian uncoordinated homology 13, domain 2 n=1 Tax=Cynara cardunculus var. scolymus TaxID=59895 RepID=A0A103Y0Q9_CYNCS|nr:Mammalian uncoordinated homology 13, domain 2 [Cynara cardunculus var. scolymus]